MIWSKLLCDFSKGWIVDVNKTFPFHSDMLATS